MKAKVSDRGRVTIPKALRDRLGLRPGQVLEFREEHGRLIASKQSREDPVESVYGVLKLRRTTDAVLRRLRGPADRT